MFVKGEIWNRFNLILEERVQFSNKTVKTWWKSVESYDTLKFCKFSRNISGNIDMNMQMSELMMS